MSWQGVSKDEELPAPTVGGTNGGAFPQTSDKNHSQLTDGSGEAPSPSQQNSKSEDTIGPASSNSSSVLPANAPTITTSPTQAGKAVDTEILT